MEVEVIRSHKRRKTISGQVKNGKIIIRIPCTLTKKQEEEVVRDMRLKLTAKVQARDKNDEDYLLERAENLNRKFFNGKLKIRSIKFVTNQEKRYGSCSPLSADIRISHRLMKSPLWVLDYILVHEMAHLIHPDHSKAFHRVVDRYPFTERAKGYLIGAAHYEDDTDYRD